MNNFNMGSLRDWNSVGVGELLAFPMPSAGYRAVSFDVVSDRFVTVHAVCEEGTWLVGAGEGFMQVKFTASEDVGVVVQGDADADVFMRTRIVPQTVGEDGEASFTTIEPRVGSRQNSEMQRMMLLMKLNTERRLAVQAEEFAAREAALDARIAAAGKPAEESAVVEMIEPTAAPVKAPADGQ